MKLSNKLFCLMFLLYLDYMKIWVRNISFLNLKLKIISRTINQFANYCHRFSFSKKSKNCNFTNLCIISNFYITSIMITILARVTRKEFLWATIFPVKPVSLPNRFLCQTSFPFIPASLSNQFLVKPVSLPNQFSWQTIIAAKTVSPRSQYWICRNYLSS